MPSKAKSAGRGRSPRNVRASEPARAENPGQADAWARREIGQCGSALLRRSRRLARRARVGVGRASAVACTAGIFLPGASLRGRVETAVNVDCLSGDIAVGDQGGYDVGHLFAVSETADRYSLGPCGGVPMQHLGID